MIWGSVARVEGSRVKTGDEEVVVVHVFVPLFLAFSHSPCTRPAFELPCQPSSRFVFFYIPSVIQFLLYGASCSSFVIESTASSACPCVMICSMKVPATSVGIMRDRSRGDSTRGGGSVETKKATGF